MAQLVEYLELNNLLSANQFGFLNARNVEDQLLVTYADIADSVDKGLLVDIIFLDFSKAFDVVSHFIILEKLQKLGIRGNLFIWIHEFLIGVMMCVKVTGNKGSVRDVSSGVAKGSVLGPVLFLFYGNHIASSVGCCRKAFADDFKLYLSFP